MTQATGDAKQGRGVGVQVRCAGCRVVLTVAKAEFECPTCQLPQMLPPELMSSFLKSTNSSPSFPSNTSSTNADVKSTNISSVNSAVSGSLPTSSDQLLNTNNVPAHGVDPTKVQVPCAKCKAILNVPHGLSRFLCPQCGTLLTIEFPTLHHSFPPPRDLSLPSAPPPMPEEVNELAIEVEREEDEGGSVGETFTDYRPAKLSIGPPHPDPIVETSSLSAAQPPEPTYELKIVGELEKSKALSCLQIETLVYASQRHLQHLPDGSRAGFFIGDGAGVGKGRTIAGLILENWRQGRKKTLWVSVGSDLKFDARRDLDDVGATFIEVHALNKLPYSKLDSKAVGIREGAIFLTYNSLIASSEKGRSRIHQLVQWCGPDFDGLIIFDECHKAKNLVPESGSQPTRTGSYVVEIQVRLKEARVVYCSATGASEPRNMGYMVRLGLWGPGTSFEDFHKFLGAIEKGGVGALELIAMDMKARGMFVCRTLSYKGAEFEVIEAPLDARMLEMYVKAAEFWAELRIELLSASAYLSNDKPNSSQLWRFYWSSHQRFFRHMCMSAKVPITVKLAKQGLSDGKCVVIGLQSTGEARTEEAVTKYGSELDDFISGPRELLLKFVDENYPLPEKPQSLTLADENVSVTQLKRRSSTPDVSLKGRVRKIAKWNTVNEDETDEESESASATDSESDDEFQICDVCNKGEDRKKLLKCSCCGQFIHPACLDPPVEDAESEDWSCHSCKERTEEFLQKQLAFNTELTKRYEAALERKLKILEIVRSLNLPNNPLDDIIDQLGGPENVAEMTGRRGMLVRASGGKGVTYQARNTKDITMEMVNMHEKQLFMDGKKLVAIISEAGSAGVSLQADKKAINQRRRIHLTLELPWSADRAIQQFGRTHRSNQASAPEYRLLFTNLGGERRFASIVAKRLETLGALTQGDRRAGPGPSLSSFNYDSAYGKKALMIMYRGIMEQDNFPVLPPGCEMEKPETIAEFITKAKAALVAVGIVRDSVLGSGKDHGKFSGRIIDSDMHDVGRFFNRLLGLPPDIQNRLFELFVSISDLLIQNARTEGSLDGGIVDMKARSVTMDGTPKTVYVDHMSGASTILFTFSLDRGFPWQSASAMLEEKQKDGLASSSDGFYESKREWLGKRHYVLASESATSGLFKIVRPAVGESVREMPIAEMKSKYRKLSNLDKARRGWEDEFDLSSKQCMHGANCKVGSFCTVGKRLQEVNILGGLILPVWGTIEKALSKQAKQSHKRLRVVRLETTTDNQRIVGLLVPNSAVQTVLQDLAWVEEE